MPDTTRPTCVIAGCRPVATTKSLIARETSNPIVVSADTDFGTLLTASRDQLPSVVLSF